MSARPDRRPRPTGAAQPARRRRRLLWGAAAAILAAAALGYLLRARGERPPEVDLRWADPAVRPAVEAAQKRVLLAPRSAAAWGELGMVLLAHDSFPEAERCLAQAGRLDPREARWPYLRALTLLKGDPDPRSAVSALERATELCGREPGPRLKLGEVYLEQGQVEAAEGQFRKALEVDREDPRAHLGLGRIALLRGDLSAALDHLARSAAKAPQVKATRALLAEVHFRAGRREAALEERRRLAGLPDVHQWPDPHFQEVLARWVGVLARIERASDLFQGGDGPAAVALLRQTIRERPEALLAHLALGRFLIQLGRPEEAEEPLRRAVQLSPDSFEAEYELGTALFQQAKLAEAAERFRRTAALKSDFAPAHAGLGRALLLQGDRPGAVEALVEAVRYRPDDAEARKLLDGLLRPSRP